MSQVDPDRDDKKKVELYQMLVELLAKEDALKETVRRSEDEVKNIGIDYAQGSFIGEPVPFGQRSLELAGKAEQLAG